MGNTFWQGEGPEYPRIVFDAIKDNLSYAELLQTVESTRDRPWFLSWFSEYLYTIRDLPIYGEVLAKMVDFMCEELQHERFQEVRPFVMVAATRVSPVLCWSCAHLFNAFLAIVPSPP
jgi:senataxin